MKLKFLPWLLVGLLAIAVGLLYNAYQQQAADLTQLRQTTQELEQRASLADTNQPQPQGAVDELNRLREENKDLLRLRNEIRQLREQNLQLTRQAQTAQAQAQSAQTQAETARATAAQASAQAQHPTDWGVVELSVNTPKHLSLTDGTDCTLTTTLLADGKLQIVIKSAEKLTEKDTSPGGPPAGTAVQTIQKMTVSSGVGISGRVGHQMLHFTPKIITP